MNNVLSMILTLKTDSRKLMGFCSLAWDLLQNKMLGQGLNIGSIEKLKVGATGQWKS